MPLMKLNDMEKGLCRKTASTLELAGERGFPVLATVDLWFSSEAAGHLYGDDFIAIAQSKLYQLNSLLMEVPGLADLEGTESGYEDLLFWAGYIFSYWMFGEGISWGEIKRLYDWERFLGCYDVMHTLSCEVAIDRCKEDFRRENKE